MSENNKLTQEELANTLYYAFFVRAAPPVQDKPYLQAYNQIKEQLQQRPTVSNKKIEDMASQIACDYPDVAFPNLIPIVRNIAKELGVEVVDG